MTENDAKQARQFGKLYFDEPGSIEARAIASFVRYRCFREPQVITREEFREFLRVGMSRTKKALAEALDLGLIYRRPSRRPGDHNLQVYSCDLRTLIDEGSECEIQPVDFQPARNPAGSIPNRLDGRNSTEVGRQSTEVGRGSTGSRSEFEPAHEAPAEQEEDSERVEKRKSEKENEK